MLSANNIERVSEKKRKLFEELENKPFEVGERIVVNESVFGYVPKERKQERTEGAKIINVDNEQRTLEVKRGDGSYGKRSETISFDDVKGRNTIPVGANPYTKPRNSLRFVAFTLDSILFTLNAFEEENRNREYKINGIPITECNWNPFVYLEDGTKKYYQRDFVWGLKEKQLLIDSIYNDIDLGKVVIRKRGLKELRRMQEERGETELAFNDIVDGKQRINTIREFIMGKFPDSFGNYFADLSFEAQNRLTSNQLLSYAEMPEDTNDEDVIEQFLKLNFAGIPQSEEHINYVKSIHSQMK